MPQRNWIHMLMSDYELKSMEENAEQALRLARELDDTTQIALALQWISEVETERAARRDDDGAPF